MTFRNTIVAALCLAVLSLATAFEPVAAQQVMPQWDHSYTAAQAERGDALYQENCAGCHGTSLRGDQYAPSLTGAAFLSKWTDRKIGDLLDLMQNTMPQNSPGGLSREQNVDLLAFILKTAEVPAGETELPAGVNVAVASRDADRDEAPTTGAGSTPYYTQQQADRGRVLFNRACIPCHIAGQTTPQDSTVQRGFWLGSQRIIMNLGDRYAHKYPSVYHLFRRIRDSMPSFNADSVSPADKVDIAAYLLKRNGFDAGPRPLPFDVDIMKTMRLPGGEAGFDAVFNGRDFSGIKFLLGPNCRPQPEGCGRTDPGSVIWIDNGEIVTSGKVQGYWYTAQRYFDFTLRFDYRFERPVDLDPGDEYFAGNSGYLLFVTEHKVWPKGIEVQGNNMNMLHSFGMDAMVTSVDDPEARQRAYRPVGEWNSVEIVSKDGEVKSYLNGLLISHVTEHEFTEAGHIGFQSEGAELHWRNIRIRAE